MEPDVLINGLRKASCPAVLTVLDCTFQSSSGFQPFVEKHKIFKQRLLAKLRGQAQRGAAVGSLKTSRMPPMV